MPPRGLPDVFPGYFWVWPWCRTGAGCLSGRVVAPSVSADTPWFCRKSTLAAERSSPRTRTPRCVLFWSLPLQAAVAPRHTAAVTPAETYSRRTCSPNAAVGWRLSKKKLKRSGFKKAPITRISKQLAVSFPWRVWFRWKSRGSLTVKGSTLCIRFEISK